LEKTRARDLHGNEYRARLIQDSNSAFWVRDLFRGFGDVTPHRRWIREFNRAQRRERLVVLPYLDIIHIDWLGGDGSYGNGVQPNRITLPLSRHTHDGFRQAVFGLRRLLIRRKVAQGMIYRGLENIESIRIKCRGWNHHILPRVHAELCVRSVLEIM